MEEKAAYQEYLERELSKRCEKNNSYSLRAFAKSLDVDPGALSRIFNGKQPLSFKMAKSIADKIDLNPNQQKQFFKSVNEVQEKRKLKRAQLPINISDAKDGAEQIEIDYFRIISDWYHTALLELTYVQDFSADPRWIAKALGISIIEAKLAVERLVKIGLLIEKDGELIKSSKNLDTADKHISTSALRNNQKQFLEKSISSLENDSIARRNHTNIVMAIDPKKLEKAKEMIQQFQFHLCEFLESGEAKEVYNLSISLSPLTSLEE